MYRMDVALVGAALVVLSAGCGPTPEEALEEFYSYREPECAMQDPLWSGGQAVVPLVIEAVQRKDMPRRVYAIAFLGEKGDRAAVEALRHITQDPSELDAFRSAALQAIAKVDPSVAAEVATLHVSADGRLGENARFINGGGTYKRMSWWDWMTYCL